jgi:hypothetical protein
MDFLGGPPRAPPENLPDKSVAIVRAAALAADLRV